MPADVRAPRAGRLRRLRVAAVAVSAGLALSVGVGPSSAATRTWQAGAGAPVVAAPPRAVISRPCPDPSVVRDSHAPSVQYWMVCTAGDPLPAITLWRSHDLHRWQQVSAGVITQRNRPATAVQYFWGPDLIHFDGRWHLYFSASQPDGRLAIFQETASRPQGPYVPQQQPVVAWPGVGVIDPDVVVAPHHRPEMLYKTDGNAIGVPSTIEIQQLSPQGGAVAGRPRTLLTSGRGDHGVIEDPVLVTVPGGVELFTSTGHFNTPSYTVKVFRAPSLSSRHWVQDPAAVVRTGPGWSGPGGQTVIRAADGSLTMLWNANPPGSHRREVLGGTLVTGRSGWPVVVPWGARQLTPRAGRVIS